MKRYGTGLLIACLALVAPAHSTDLTINFTGTWRNGTCSFAVSDIDLGTYQATAFTGSYNTPWRQFNITRSNCTSDIRTINMSFTGTADSSDAHYYAVRSSTGNVTGMAIQLQNLSNVTIAPNVTTLGWLSTQGNIYTLQARLVQTLPSVTAGTVRTPVTIQITYT